MAKAKAKPKKAVVLKENQKLVQVEMAKLTKKGWRRTDLYGTGLCIVSEKRLKQWEKDGKRSFDGFEEELTEAMKE